MICFAAITPHPPIIVPGIGDPPSLKAVAKTCQAMKQLGGELAQAKPDTIILISPHAPTDYYAFGINMAANLRGSLADFGLRLPFTFANNLALAKEIYHQANQEFIPVSYFYNHLDHGALVPLYYLTDDIKPQLLELAFSFLDFATHYKYGQVIGQVIKSKKQRVALIASGDLSHRLTLSAPAGYSPQGKIFDEQLISWLSHNKIDNIINWDAEMVAAAGECGLRSFIILLGAIEQEPHRFAERSYEGPFGVGYLTARLI